MIVNKNKVAMTRLCMSPLLRPQQKVSLAKPDLSQVSVACCFPGLAYEQVDSSLG
jgi:hypothetical protein